MKENKNENKTEQGSAKCPFCKREHKYTPNYNEYRILRCIKCNKVFKIRPDKPQYPYLEDERPDIIYRLTDEDLIQLMHQALEMNDKEWFEELGEKRRQLLNGWWVGASDLEGGYYD